MSNIFLSTLLIFLASEAAGCLDKNGKVADSCETSVYGMRPASLVANIAILSGVLSALLMPIAGAMVDYTAYRRTLGCVSAFLMILIQAIQIGTVLQTWFPRSVLQGIAGFLYQVQVLATYAYLPDIARSVGESSMTRFVISILLGFNDVQTGIDTIWSGLAFFLGWRILQPVPSAHALPDGKTLFSQAFVQVWQTCKKINNVYGQSLRWFLLAVVFAEAAANAFTVVSAVFLADQLRMTGTEIGVFLW
ncbi:Vacuole effluxer Atg22-like protein [Fragilaria crotonensis]|nr:Vacuole effluxer Atg22-like protein [Fragilaria crotonensis]